MQQEEWEGARICAACGAQVPAGGRIFAFGTDNALCGECGVARGGRYDAERDVWDVQPDLTGLTDEAYGAAPHEKRRV